MWMKVLLETISYMQNNNVQGVYLAHCTSDEVCQNLRNVCHIEQQQ